jgi:hypothetical protein
LVTNEISKKEFDFAMVGCGGIGLLVIDFIKNNSNEYWVCPFGEDVPKNFMKFENGGYWVK